MGTWIIIVNPCMFSVRGPSRCCGAEPWKPELGEDAMPKRSSWSPRRMDLGMGHRAMGYVCLERL